MNRILVIILLFGAGLSGCSKSNDVAAQISTQSVIDNKLITNYLTGAGLPINNVDTISFTTGLAGHTGICYVVDTTGTGNGLYTSATTITVGYTGQTLTAAGPGAIFQQTNNFHPSFVLGQVIRGWQLGLAKAKAGIGGVVRLYIPSRYAYGPYAQPGVGLPPNAVLLFTIKLYNISN